MEKSKALNREEAKAPVTRLEHRTAEAATV
jgi:hypothetical protein